MPQTDIHIEASVKKTGKSHQAVHAFVDFEKKKPERHDVTKMVDYTNLMESRYGVEAAQEFVQHIHDDIQCKFKDFIGTLKKLAGELSNGDPTQVPVESKLNTLVFEAESKLKGILDYFGVVEGKNVRLYRVAEADVELLRKAGVSEDDIRHCLAVAAKALEIAHRTGAALDFGLIGRGALFHDLGKSKTHAIEHGKLGAEMGKNLGLPAAIADIMEKHIRGGLTEAEATELGLPVKDYRLNSIEEKIVIYADRLVDIILDGVVKTDEEAEQRFEEILTTQIKYGKNDITLKRYLGYHREIQALMGFS
jgi:uncharacterized protein